MSFIPGICPAFARTDNVYGALVSNEPISIQLDKTSQGTTPYAISMSAFRGQTTNAAIYIQDYLSPSPGNFGSLLSFSTVPTQNGPGCIVKNTASGVDSGFELVINVAGTNYGIRLMNHGT